MNNDTVTPQIHPNSEQEVSSCCWLTLLDLKWPKHTHTPPTQHCILYTHTHTHTHTHRLANHIGCHWSCTCCICGTWSRQWLVLSPWDNDSLLWPTHWLWGIWQVDRRYLYDC